MNHQPRWHMVHDDDNDDDRKPADPLGSFVNELTRSKARRGGYSSIVLISDTARTRPSRDIIRSLTRSESTSSSASSSRWDRMSECSSHSSSSHHSQHSRTTPPPPLVKTLKSKRALSSPSLMSARKVLSSSPPPTSSSSSSNTSSSLRGPVHEFETIMESPVTGQKQKLVSCRWQEQQHQRCSPSGSSLMRSNSLPTRKLSPEKAADDAAGARLALKQRLMISHRDRTTSAGCPIPPTLFDPPYTITTTASSED